MSINYQIRTKIEIVPFESSEEREERFYKFKKKEANNSIGFIQIVPQELLLDLEERAVDLVMDRMAKNVGEFLKKKKIHKWKVETVKTEVRR